MRTVFTILLCFGFFIPVYAQTRDSLVLTLPEVEKIFLEKNLLLLAQRYQVDAAKANEIQQRLYNNPSFSTELAVHGSNNKWFDIGTNGQKEFGIDQLIILAGKRNKRLLLAREQTNQAQIEFYDLLRTLRYELNQSFYAASYANELIKKIDEQLSLLQQIILSYDEQAAKGNVPLKDAVRLKTEYIQLSADRNSTIMESLRAQQDLQLLLDTNSVIVPSNTSLDKPIPELQSLIEAAKKNRTDLQLHDSYLRQEQLNYNYQRALAAPDLTVGAGYDHNGSYIPKLYTVRAAIDLPFFSRNQGNIKAAKAQIRSAELTRDFKQSSIEKEVSGSLARLQEAEREYRLTQRSFNKDFPIVNENMIRNFNKGNVSMLEFLDFFENYNTTIRQLNELSRQRRLAWEELSFSVGTAL